MEANRQYAKARKDTIKVNRTQVVLRLTETSFSCLFISSPSLLLLLLNSSLSFLLLSSSFFLLSLFIFFSFPLLISLLQLLSRQFLFFYQPSLLPLPLFRLSLCAADSSRSEFGCCAAAGPNTYFLLLSAPRRTADSELVPLIVEVGQRTASPLVEGTPRCPAHGSRLACRVLPPLDLARTSSIVPL